MQYISEPSLTGVSEPADMMTAPSLRPDFSKGLLPAIAQDADTLAVLMLAWMNEAAYEKSLVTGLAHYWSRSRGKLWLKGEESGHTQKIVSVRLDCDCDAILLLVRQNGGACHTGHSSCFYRELGNGGVAICSPLVFDPEKTYGQKA